MVRSKQYRRGPDSVVEIEEVHTTPQRCISCNLPLPHYEAMEFGLQRRRKHVCKCGALYKTKRSASADGRMWDLMRTAKQAKEMKKKTTKGE